MLFIDAKLGWVTVRTQNFLTYQIITWALVFAVITGSIELTRGLVENELFYAVALIGTTGLYSIFIRYIYKRFLHTHHLLTHIVYFALQSFVGAVLAALSLVLTVVAFAYFDIIPSIPLSNFPTLINTLFWGNCVNMVITLIFWCTAYMLIINVRQVYEVKEALASTQLDALSQQLNPHFLFNTLNNIRAVILEDPQKARDAIVQLSDMLRYSLVQNIDAKVSVAQELAITEEYIALCKIQFEDRLIFTQALTPNAKFALVPRMLLQLCVENAVKHGIAKLRDGGVIALRINVVDTNHSLPYLRIELDNPIGETHQSGSDKDEVISHTGVGINNIKQRLNLLYTNSKSIKPSLEMIAQSNTMKVIIKLPFEPSSTDVSLDELVLV